ncbi:MAG TPA: replication-relaxation family protein [Solirubrobacteraceae bacterium]|jgi:hypothetical protein
MSSYASASRVRDLSRILSERDMRILQSVAELRFVSGSQLRRMHVSGGTPLGNERVTRRVLQRLVELGVLDRLERRIGGPLAGGSEGYVYLLASGGAHLAYRRQLVARARRRKTAVPGQLFVRHSLAVSELHTRLVEAEREGIFDCLARQPEPACWRRFRDAEGQELTLKPDTFLRVSDGVRERDYMVDVDRGTEGSRTLERRLRIYTQYLQWGRGYAGDELPRVLWLARTDKRVAVIEDVREYLPRQSRSVFSVAHFDQAIEMIRELL